MDTEDLLGSLGKQLLTNMERRNEGVVKEDVKEDYKRVNTRLDVVQDDMKAMRGMMENMVQNGAAGAAMPPAYHRIHAPLAHMPGVP